MASYFAAISSALMPRIAPFMNTFSRPVNSGLKPLPSSSSAPIRPDTATCPWVGDRVPQMVCSSVDLPEPFRPMMPTVSPRATENDTSRSAQDSRKNRVGSRPIARCRRGISACFRRFSGRSYSW